MLSTVQSKSGCEHLFSLVFCSGQLDFSVIYDCDQVNGVEREALGRGIENYTAGGSYLTNYINVQVGVAQI